MTPVGDQGGKNVFKHACLVENIANVFQNIYILFISSSASYDKEGSFTWSKSIPDWNFTVQPNTFSYSYL